MAGYRLGAGLAGLIALAWATQGSAQTLMALNTAPQAPESRPAPGDGAGTAEGLALSDYAVRRAALQLADDVAKGLGPNPQPVWLIVGATPPTTAGWLAYQHQKQAVADDLAVAIRQWDRVKDVDPDKTSRKSARTPSSAPPQPISPAAISATALTTGTHLAKTRYVAAGGAPSPADLETRAVIAGALRQRQIAVDYESMTLTDAPAVIENDLSALRDGDYRQALARYDAYTDKLVRRDGDTRRMNETILASGKALRTAIDNFDAFERGLFVPVDGVLPATEIVRQKALFDRRASQPLLYVTSVRSNLTTVPRKKGVAGVASKPVALRAAALIDYGLIKDGTAASFSTASFKTDEVRFDDAATFIGWGYSDKAPALPRHHKNHDDDDDDWW